MTNFSVGVSIGSTSIQGLRLSSEGEPVPLFFDNDTPSGLSTKNLKSSKELTEEFLNYLFASRSPGTKVALYNSFGYSLDGGKAKGDDIGCHYSFVENIENFSDKTLAGIMAEVIQENPIMKQTFVVINRNVKKVDGSEISGQWPIQAQSYLIDQGQEQIEWLIDLGGKSGTLYHFEGGKFVKSQTIMSDAAPNVLIKQDPEDFKVHLSIELAHLQSAGIDLSKTAILQTGEARDGSAGEVDIFSKDVAYHSFLPQEAESYYEAIDFMRTVLECERATSFDLVSEPDNKLSVVTHMNHGFLYDWYQYIMSFIF